jgi:hypothetical protein
MNETPELPEVAPKKRGGRPKKPAVDVTQLSNQLAEAMALIKRQGETIQALSQVKAGPGPSPAAPPPDLRLVEAQAEIDRLRRQIPDGGSDRLIPYEGMVQATEPCAYGCLHSTGDVFHVKVPALWTDDPYRPVVVKGLKEDGKPITEANPLAPEPVDFRLRSRTGDVLYQKSLEIRRASDSNDVLT